MNALARASKQALQTAARGFASGAYPDRKVAVLGAAGEPHSSGWVRDQCSGAELHVAATRPIAALLHHCCQARKSGMAGPRPSHRQLHALSVMVPPTFLQAALASPCRC